MRGLEIHSVSWRYGRKAVLDDVSLEVCPGVFCALLGPNGAGKTTLFSIATRLFHARQGRVTVDGIDLDRQPGAAPIAAHNLMRWRRLQPSENPN